jgi:hypothetical protein
MVFVFYFLFFWMQSSWCSAFSCPTQRQFSVRLFPCCPEVGWCFAKLEKFMIVCLFVKLYWVQINSTNILLNIQLKRAVFKRTRHKLDVKSIAWCPSSS